MFAVFEYCAYHLVAIFRCKTDLQNTLAGDHRKKVGGGGVLMHVKLMLFSKFSQILRCLSRQMECSDRTNVFFIPDC